jgi:hypothetical protein
MWLGREIKARQCTPGPDYDIVVFAFANRNALVWEIGDTHQNLAHSGLGRFGILLQFGNLLAGSLGLFDQRGRILLVLLELRNLFGGLVALRLQGLCFGDSSAAAGVDIMKALQYFCWIHAPLAKLFFHKRQMVTYESQVEHK